MYYHEQVVERIDIAKFANEANEWAACYMMPEQWNMSHKL